MKTQTKQDPYLHHDINEKRPIELGLWPCYWISCPDAPAPPFISAFRRQFHLDQPVVLKFHVSADERYVLFIDEVLVGRGPERGDRDHWFYETYEVPLSAGSHMFLARVWSLGSSAPFAQISIQPGFILSPEDERYIPLLGTGIAAWEALVLRGYSFTPTEIPHFTSVGDNLVLNGREFPWGYERGAGAGWQPAARLDPGVNASRHSFERSAHLLTPAVLPEMLSETRQVGKVRFVSSPPGLNTRPIPVQDNDCLSGELSSWQDWLDGKKEVSISAGERRRVLIDLENYYCIYPKISVSGGKNGQVRLFWAESLYLDANAREKGNRDQISGKYFLGKGDTFLLDGESKRGYDTLWWQAGRYIELCVESGDTPLVLEKLELVETRYPLESSAQVNSGDTRFNRLFPIAVRALQMCSHETYMDCPYYEQLMYIGDTRLEVLVNYQITPDDRLPQKALRLFDFSHQPTGLTASRYPSRERQIIPPFSLWWIGMVYDHALWRGNPDFIRSLMPGVRGVLDAFLGFRNAQGLIQAPRGWNFVDWVPGWVWGIPIEGTFGANAIINWQFTWILRQAAELEAWLGEPELAARDLRLAREMAESTQDAFWDKNRNLFADDLAHSEFSEHAQCMALLSGELDAEIAQRTARSLWSDPDLARTTIYFSHYLFETCQKLNRIDVLEERLGLWYGHEALGMKTTLESPEPSRSDCHAWGAHPIYHYFATILGVRPARMGYRSVRISPQLGSLPYAKGSVVHPAGLIDIEIHRKDNAHRAKVILPEGVEGSLESGIFKTGLKSCENVTTWSQ